MFIAPGDLVSDVTARAIVLALAENDSIGVAILAPPRWDHVLANAAYENVLGVKAALGRTMAEVAVGCSTIAELLDDVACDGEAAFVTDIAVSSPGGSPDRHASLALLRLGMKPSPSILVIAQDVTERFKEWRALNLSVDLAADLAASHDLPETIRAATSRGAEALDASRVSIFLASRNGTSLEGAFGDWYPTRDSGNITIDAWPNVKRAIDSAAPVYLGKNDARGDERAWFEDERISTTLCVPLISAHDVLGVMFFDFASPTPEALVDVGVAKGIADQCASALAVIKATISASALRLLWSLSPPHPS